MQRGEVRLIDLEPARGSEANKRRPAIIVSNDRANATAERLGRGVVSPGNAAGAAGAGAAAGAAGAGAAAGAAGAGTA